jgi:excisionase family DNA binding protein
MPVIEATPNADGEIVVRVRVVPPSAPVDELVTLDACGLERRAVEALIREGRLRAVKIGRRVYVRRSAVVALVDELPAWTPNAGPLPGAKTEDDDLGRAVMAVAKRRARRAA